MDHTNHLPDVFRTVASLIQLVMFGRLYKLWFNLGKMVQEYLTVDPNHDQKLGMFSGCSRE